MHKEQVVGKEYLKSLTALSIETELVKQLNFDEIIDFFFRKNKLEKLLSNGRCMDFLCDIALPPYALEFYYSAD